MYNKHNIFCRQYENQKTSKTNIWSIYLGNEATKRKENHNQTYDIYNEKKKLKNDCHIPLLLLVMHT